MPLVVYGSSPTLEKLTLIGEPMVVYHGTGAIFNRFEHTNDGGYHFGTMEQAENRNKRNLMPVFLNIKNTQRTTDKMDGQRNTIKTAIKNGYDGLYYNNIFEGEGLSYVAFNPNQIKSATDNVGSFSAENNDIRYQSRENSTFAEKLSAKDMKIVEKIKNLFTIARRNRSKVIKEKLDAVSERQIADMRMAGINFSNNYTHTIDNSAILHSMRQHGSERTEVPRGQIAITEADFERIPLILNDYDVLTTDKNNRGQDVVILQKSFGDGTTYYVEEVRTGREELAMATIYKKKTSTNAGQSLTDGLMPAASSVLSSTSATPSAFSVDKGTTKKSNDQTISEKYASAKKEFARKVVNAVVHGTEKVTEEDLDTLHDLEDDVKLHAVPAPSAPPKKPAWETYNGI